MGCIIPILEDTAAPIRGDKRTINLIEQGGCHAYLSVRNSFTGSEDAFVFCEIQKRWMDQDNRPMPRSWMQTFAEMLELNETRNREPGRIFEIFAENTSYNIHRAALKH